MALTKVTEKIITDNLSISGIASASNFKTGTTDVHSVGVTAGSLVVGSAVTSNSDGIDVGDASYTNGYTNDFNSGSGSKNRVYFSGTYSTDF